MFRENKSGQTHFVPTQMVDYAEWAFAFIWFYSFLPSHGVVLTLGKQKWGGNYRIIKCRSLGVNETVERKT